MRASIESLAMTPIHQELQDLLASHCLVFCGWLVGWLVGVRCCGSSMKLPSWINRATGIFQLCPSRGKTAAKVRTQRERWEGRERSDTERKLDVLDSKTWHRWLASRVYDLRQRERQNRQRARKARGREGPEKNTYVATHGTFWKFIARQKLKIISKVAQSGLVNHCGQERPEHIDRSDYPRRQAVEQV